MTSSTPPLSPGSPCAESKDAFGINQGECPACHQRARLIDYGPIDYCQECHTYCAKERITRVAYDAEYVAERYEKYSTTTVMSERRLDVVEQVIHLFETLPIGRALARGRLLDVGYGNGAFLREAARRGWETFGNDVNPTPYEGVRPVPLPVDPLPEVERYRVITFFDAIEHFEDLADAPQIAQNTDWLAITVPKAPSYFLSQDWKHYRPGEHHFYWWNARSFEKIFGRGETRVSLVYVDSPEDTIRGKLPDGLDNTMTCVLRCQRAL